MTADRRSLLPPRPPRRAFVHAMLAVALGCTVPLAACAHAPEGPVASHLASVELYDRHEDVALPVYTGAGERWVVGVPGHEYTIRIRNLTGARILAVPSVDGVNAISGETAAPDQSGYVLEPWGFLEIAGWRKSSSQTAAFYFADVRDSYAARTGRPGDLGVIGVAVFREKVPAVAMSSGRLADRTESAAPSASATAANAMPAAPAPLRDEAQARERSAESARLDAMPPEKRLGTGHGRRETSYARTVAFERATRAPEAIVAIRYDRRENLVARGIVPAPRVAEHRPRPFPGGAGFVPDPR